MDLFLKDQNVRSLPGLENFLGVVLMDFQEQGRRLMECGSQALCVLELLLAVIRTANIC